MKTFLLSLTVLAVAAAVQAQSVPCDAQADVAARVALALAQQAPVTPQAPPAARTTCACGGSQVECVCTADKCTCANGADCRAATKAPHYSFLVISRSACVPCEKLRVELTSKWASLDSPDWDIWKDSPGTEAVYGGITAYPTILLLRRRDGEKVGREIGRHVGYMSTAELQRWLDNPDAPQSRGEAVEKAAPVVYTPQYQPMMRYSAACRGSS